MTRGEKSIIAALNEAYGAICEARLAMRHWQPKNPMSKQLARKNMDSAERGIGLAIAFVHEDVARRITDEE